MCQARPRIMRFHDHIEDLYTVEMAQQRMDFGKQKIVCKQKAS